MKRLIIILGLVGAVVAVFAFMFVDTFPRRIITANHMLVIKRCLLQHAHSHGELPYSLTGLPEMQGRENDTRDGWGRNIILEVSSSDIVTLRSLGRDGIVGGSGEDADMIGAFPSRDDQGRWSDEMVAWSHDPLPR